MLRPPSQLPKKPPLLPLETVPPPPASVLPGAASWDAVLRGVGWPDAVVVLDWETYFDKEYSLRKLSTIEYIEDSRFEELGVSVLVVPKGYPNSPKKATFWADVPGVLAYLQRRFGPNLENCTVVGQNMRFDGCILARKHGILPPHVVDVMYLASHLDARAKHDLASLCTQYRLEAKGDTSQFLGVHRADLDLERLNSLTEYANNDAEREMELFSLLLPQITNPKIELPLGQHTLKMFWQPKLRLDFIAADRLASEMSNELSQLVTASGVSAEDLSGTNSFVGLLTAALPEGQTVPTKQGKKKLIPAFAKDDEEMKALLVHPDAKVRALVHARQAVKSWPLHLGRIESLKAQAKAAGGWLPVPLKYYGAGTGRWSGGEKINLQNLSKRGGSMACRIRGLITAPEDAVLIVVDAAQIEARITFWLAGQTDALKAFETGRDIYSEFISEVLAKPCRKPRKTDPPAVAKTLTRRRMQGKIAVLGLGYGMGFKRFFEFQNENDDLAPLIASGEITLASCKDVVDRYRSRYSMVPKLWTRLENTFRNTVKYGRIDISPTGPIIMFRDETTAVVRLPSGRCLFYPNARLVVDQDGHEVLRYKHGPLWGGILAENIVQAIARDVLAEALLRVEDSGFPVALHVHDELVAVCPTKDGRNCLRIVVNELQRRPAWASDLPLDAEGEMVTRYGKV